MLACSLDVSADKYVFRLHSVSVAVVVFFFKYAWFQGPLGTSDSDSGDHVNTVALPRVTQTLRELFLICVPI